MKTTRSQRLSFVLHLFLSLCTLAAFAQITLVGAVSGGVLLAVLNRRSSDPHRRFIQMTIGLPALSGAAPAAFADTVASRFALVALHLAAAAIIVPVLARYAG